jgi:hypothetical protein
LGEEVFIDASPVRGHRGTNIFRDLPTNLLYCKQFKRRGRRRNEFRWKKEGTDR